jgi:hypothetical protein
VLVQQPEAIISDQSPSCLIIQGSQSCLLQLSISHQARKVDAMLLESWLQLLPCGAMLPAVVLYLAVSPHQEELLRDRPLAWMEWLCR